MGGRRGNRRRGTGGGRGGRTSRRRSRAARALTFLALSLILGSVAAVAWLMIVYPHRTPPGDGREVLIEIPEGATVSEVSARLGQEGIVDDPWLFAAYLRILDVGGRLRAGPVLVDDRMTPAELVRQVAAGFGRGRVRVTIPEGWSRWEIARRLEEHRVCSARAFLAETENGALLAERGIAAENLEGYLFPDTYELREDMTAREVVERLVRTWERRVGPVLEAHADGLAALQAELGWGTREVLVLASIVEKEAAAAEERPVIAGVFLNRLRSESFRPQRLQADPTVSYGCIALPDISEACRAFDGRDITRPMLRDPLNPYNTYRHDGLPPGPIANPGLASIQAVLAPAQHDYFYFVARGGGRHRFSHSLGDHNAAVREHVLGAGASE